MSKNKIKKNNLTKIISFGLAIIVALGGGCVYFYNKLQSYKLALENNYRHSLQDLNEYVDNICNYLDKSLYVGTAYQLSNISAKLLSDSRAAKVCLSSLPISELHLDNTFKFLSQVGDYAFCLNKQYHENSKISDDEYESLKSLSGYAKKFNSYISDLENNVLKNNINLNNNKIMIKTEDKNSSNIDFDDLEKKFTGYPSLIYDGPFSDHISKKTPELTKNMKEISIEKAKKIAALATGISENKLVNSQDENSSMSLYCFASDNISIGVTKKGGIICYILKSREVKKPEIETGKAIENAKQYIKDTLKISDIEQSYYEVNNNYCIINFATKQKDFIMYPDLIKVSVALDNGEVTSVDARGYINNHKERKITEPKKSIEEAQKVLSKYLTVIKEPRQAIIPTEGKNEVMTYEFVCRGNNDENVLVYINCDTLEEEQILILIDSQKGILTV